MTGELFSTRDLSGKRISYTDSIIQGLASDGGLFVPTEYPRISPDELRQWSTLPYTELAFQVKRKFVGEAIPDEVLRDVQVQAYSPEKFSNAFEVVPVENIGPELFLQNLSLGPTAAFKDMALQPLAYEMDYELGRRNQRLDILGATSGDTGSSAEAGAKGRERLRVFMLSPKYGMSAFQKAQMGVLSGGNIYNISIINERDKSGFDTCQGLAKQLSKKCGFGAVNSTNWGRVAAQVVYYVSGYLQVTKRVGDEVDFVVPTGNFGNVLAGYIAKQMGVLIRNLIIATNENNVLERLVSTGVYEKRNGQVTSSPSMDITISSNYERLLFDLLGRNPELTKKYMSEFEMKGRVDFRDFGLSPESFKQLGFYAGSSTHENRLDSIRRIHRKNRLIIDPHTADGITVARQFQTSDGVPMVVMQTALAVKFEKTIQEALGFIPEREKRFEDLESRVPCGSFHTMEPDANKLEEYIKNHIN
jgi:threonine synthase